MSLNDGVEIHTESMWNPATERLLWYLLSEQYLKTFLGDDDGDDNNDDKKKRKLMKMNGHF